MIFGVAPLPGVLQTTATQAALTTANDPNATAAQKQAAAQILQALIPAPDFFTQNRTALLLGGSAVVLAGVGYWFFHRKPSRRR
jgi:hypothetical protein